MIQIFYDTTAHRVTVSGHAGTAPHGEDLLCAAATALTLTLASNVRAMEARGAVQDMHCELEDGSADISCSPASGYGALVALIFDSICMGFADMAEANPEHVSYRSK